MWCSKQSTYRVCHLIVVAADAIEYIRGCLLQIFASIHKCGITTKNADTLVISAVLDVGDRILVGMLYFLVGLVNYE